MQKYVILVLSLIFSTISFADLKLQSNDSLRDTIELLEVEEAKVYGDTDGEVEQPNYRTFTIYLKVYFDLYNEEKNSDIKCSYIEMLKNFLESNKKYAYRLNEQIKAKGKSYTYEEMLNEINKNYIRNYTFCKF